MMSQHRCYLCDAENPERIFVGGVASFPPRFAGPPMRAHGGMAVAALLCPALREAKRSGMANPAATYVSGRLHAPVPLETGLAQHVERGEEYRVALAKGEQTMVSGSVRIIDRELATQDEIAPVPDHLANDLAALCEQADACLEGPSLQVRNDRHYQEAGYENSPNHCLGCGEKPHNFKLSYRLTESGDIWSRWPIGEEFSRGERLPAALAVAGLDCANLWVQMAQEDRLGFTMKLEESQMWITGSHSVHFLRVPPIGGDFRVLSRQLLSEGRKGFAMSALVDATGTLYAVAEAVNIKIDVPPEMGLKKIGEPA